MMRSAISPRLATRTRLIMVVRYPPSVVGDGSSRPSWRTTADGLSITLAAPDLTHQSERAKRLAERRRGARGPRVQRERRIRPRPMLVQGDAERGEHEVTWGHAVGPSFGSCDPHERPSGPLDPPPGFRWPLEGHADAHRALLHELAEPRVAS